MSKNERGEEVRDYEVRYISNEGNDRHTIVKATDEDDALLVAINEVGCGYGDGIWKLISATLV